MCSYYFINKWILLFIYLTLTYQQTTSHYKSNQTIPVNDNRVLIPHEQQVYRYIMNNYESSVRPLKNISEKLTVKISIRLQQISGLDERNQVLTTILFLEQIWEDEYLKWNESEFGNVRTLRIPAKQVWTPDTYVFNNADHTSSGFLEGVYVLVHSSGRISWPIPVQLKTFCQVDITLFPFDQQNCEIQFGSWMYTSDWIEYKFQTNQHHKSTTTTDKNWKYTTKLLPSLVSLMLNKSNRHVSTKRRDHNEEEQDNVDSSKLEEDYLTRNALDTSSYWDSTDWMLKHAILSYTYRSTDTLTVWKPTTSISNIQIYDNKLDSRQTDLVLKLFLQRRSFFYIWNIVIPCILLTLLTLITFWTPINSGEKVTLGLSVFLAFSMFMMLIAERVPPTAKNIPLIGVYMTSVMSITTGTVVVCVIVINLDAKGEKLSRAPKWLRRITQFGLCQFFYKENCHDMNESAAISSLIEKFSTMNSIQEKKLFEINNEIITLTKLSNLLYVNNNLNKEIQSICHDYFQQLNSFNEASSSPIYHHNIIVNKSSSSYHQQPSTDSPTLSEVKPSSTYPIMKSDNIKTKHSIHKISNSTKQDYLPLSILHNLNQFNLTTYNVNSSINISNKNQSNLNNQNNITNELIKYEWKIIAKITDRLLFICFIIITFICYICIFIWPLISGSAIFN
uniref:Nicotinic acetylcholine receptor n=1 Tax=Schistosoma mansoni TaxID=6183 RepID=V9TJE9_SCHMA|nr:nicotinic acetylcholine receptor [Schistosoma mansoni]